MKKKAGKGKPIPPKSAQNARKKKFNFGFMNLDNAAGTEQLEFVPEDNLHFQNLDADPDTQSLQ